MISVIITTCNRPIAILERCINSVISQTYKELEIILVNDAPHEDKLRKSIEALLEYYPQILYIVNDERVGACNSRNAGAARAKGEYLAFLDDDDSWREDKLEKQLRILEKDEKAVLVTCYVQLSNGQFYNINQEYEGVVTDKLLGSNFISGCSAPLIRKSTFDSVKGFDSRYESSQDLNLWLKLSMNGTVRFIKEPLVKYADSTDAISKSIKKRLQGWQLLLDDFEALYKKYPVEKRSFLFMIAIELKRYGDRKGALQYYLKGLSAKGIDKSCLRVLKILCRQ